MAISAIKYSSLSTSLHEKWYSRTICCCKTNKIPSPFWWTFCKLRKEQSPMDYTSSNGRLSFQFVITQFCHWCSSSKVLFSNILRVDRRFQWIGLLSGKRHKERQRCIWYLRSLKRSYVRSIPKITQRLLFARSLILNFFGSGVIYWGYVCENSHYYYFCRAELRSSDTNKSILNKSTCIWVNNHTF